MEQIDVELDVKLDESRLEVVPSWGGASASEGWVFRPTTAEQIADVFTQARRTGLTVGLRGGGNSYGDAAYNHRGIVLDLTRCKRILEWNPDNGIVTVEPGVTLRELWEYTLADGWWPPICTGTMYITIGGGAAMNVHGKNSFNAGTLGDHIIEFEMMLPNSETIIANRDENSDIFHAAIGGFGMLGCFTRITLQMKRVQSGELDVEVINSDNFHQMFAQFEQLTPKSDYLVGWVDCTSSGRHTGRGEIHRAQYVKNDKNAPQTLRIEHQHLGDTLYGIVPRSAMWRFMQPFFNRLGIPWVNRGKFYSSKMKDGGTYRQPHAQFHFLLNYFPDWKKAVGKGGLIQYQPFVPAVSAQRTFTAILHHCQKRGLEPYLGVLKRHRPDPFLLTHGLDGYSFALDFRITEQNRAEMVKLCHQLDEMVLAAGGRFYPAKDSTLRPTIARAYLGDDAINQFRALKHRCDPDDILQTNFWRRVFPVGK